MILAKERPSHPHASGWSISGGSGIPDDELRRQIRVRLSEARLPLSMVCGCPTQELADPASCVEGQ